MGSTQCFADAGASIQLETTVINPSVGVYIPTGGSGYVYIPTIPPIVTTPPVTPSPTVIQPTITPPKITVPPTDSTTPAQPLPTEPTKPFPWNYILIALLGVVGITIFILGLRKRNEA